MLGKVITKRVSWWVWVVFGQVLWGYRCISLRWCCTVHRGIPGTLPRSPIHSGRSKGTPIVIARLRTVHRGIQSNDLKSRFPGDSSSQWWPPASESYRWPRRQGNAGDEHLNPRIALSSHILPHRRCTWLANESATILLAWPLQKPPPRDRWGTNPIARKNDRTYAGSLSQWLVQTSHPSTLGTSRTSRTQACSTNCQLYNSSGPSSSFLLQERTKEIYINRFTKYLITL